MKTKNVFLFDYVYYARERKINAGIENLLTISRKLLFRRSLRTRIRTIHSNITFDIKSTITSWSRELPKLRTNVHKKLYFMTHLICQRELQHDPLDVCIFGHDRMRNMLHVLHPNKYTSYNLIQISFKKKMSYWEIFSRCSHMLPTLCYSWHWRPVQFTHVVIFRLVYSVTFDDGFFFFTILNCYRISVCNTRPAINNFWHDFISIKYTRQDAFADTRLIVYLKKCGSFSDRRLTKKNCLFTNNSEK
jgi:hypothetical protein